MNPRFLEWIFPRLCAHCGQDAPGWSPPPLCGDCREKMRTPSLPIPQSPSIHHWEAGFDFEGPVRKIIHLFKFKNRDYLCGWLGEQLVERVSRPPAGSVLIPVPSSFIRFMGRGFNPAEAIARELGRRWGVPVAPKALRRRELSLSQTRLSKAGRQANVEGLFLPGRIPPNLNSAVLIDDVITTGATLSACARLLMQGGASRVEVRAAAYESSKIGESHALAPLWGEF